jgi:hypothetical protein
LIFGLLSSGFSTEDPNEFARRIQGQLQTARMERRNGILQLTLHTEGQSLRWGFPPHGELPEAFHDIGADRKIRS